MAGEAPGQHSGTVRVRFAPSPTGYLHIGGARTVLFNWLFARQTQGVFVLRIEDTDQTRHVEDSVKKILEDLRWLGLTWDEGPEVDGPFGPYSQSQRLDMYNRYAEQLLRSGHAYYALETPQQLQAMREAAERRTGGFRYPRPDPLPTIAEGQAARAAGRPVVVRFKMPDEPITVVDQILGEVTVSSEQHEDFVLQKGDGFPTYHFACVVDDELMRITHVLRGQEHLMNTPKHVALQQALGFRTPGYAHLPIIFNMDGSKMSKRDKQKALDRGQPAPEIDVHDFRAAGYLPEALLNFVALLGWSAGDDREFFTLDELVSSFRLNRIGKTNARFDREKLLAFNTTWATRVLEDRLLTAFKDYLAITNAPPIGSAMRTTSSEPPAEPVPISSGAGAAHAGRQLIFQSTGGTPNDDELRAILRACAGFRTFADVLKKARFLFTSDDAIQYDPKAVKSELEKNNGSGFAILEFLLPKFEAIDHWCDAELDALIQRACQEKQTGMNGIAQPIRVAISGSKISPAIHHSLALLGKYHTISRLKRCLALRS